MWGLIPAAGAGSRIQPLAFSKELLPLGTRQENGRERPRAVSEYLIERMLLAGVDKLCFVISPGKTDILQYYGNRVEGADVCYVVQPEPAGLCDALFRAAFLAAGDSAQDWIVGLPDTLWFPEDALAALPGAPLSFLLFPVQNPELFDAVLTDDCGNVQRVDVKQSRAATSWVWGAFRVQGAAFQDLFQIWRGREPRDEYWGTLVNAWLREGGSARAVKTGEVYIDIGTVRGYREGLQTIARYSENKIHENHVYNTFLESGLEPEPDRAAGAGPGPMVP
ncbi:MAG TPA: sugar phosphate nucleotidyltransferase [Bryobacteraceae bacterium]|nr:sugar phosphate nucleotidyltransferase [Bryobacteraceae bacterium]